MDHRGPGATGRAAGRYRHLDPLGLLRDGAMARAARGRPVGLARADAPATAEPRAARHPRPDVEPGLVRRVRGGGCRDAVDRAAAGRVADGRSGAATSQPLARWRPRRGGGRGRRAHGGCARLAPLVPPARRPWPARRRRRLSAHRAHDPDRRVRARHRPDGSSSRPAPRRAATRPGLPRSPIAGGDHVAGPGAPDRVRALACSARRVHAGGQLLRRAAHDDPERARAAPEGAPRSRGARARHR